MRVLRDVAVNGLGVLGAGENEWIAAVLEVLCDRVVHSAEKPSGTGSLGSIVIAATRPDYGSSASTYGRGSYRVLLMRVIVMLCVSVLIDIADQAFNLHCGSRSFVAMHKANLVL